MTIVPAGGSNVFSNVHVMISPELTLIVTLRSEVENVLPAVPVTTHAGVLKPSSKFAASPSVMLWPSIDVVHL